MDTETEMIRQQMDETRTALTDKLEVLEHQVVDTMQGASSAVAETVENVKDIVRDTVQTVNDSVHETVETVKDAFDFKRQVDRRPWTMLGGATALGFLAGYSLRRRSPGQGRTARSGSMALAAEARTAVAGNGELQDLHASAREPEKGTSSTTDSAKDEPSLLANLADMFQPEITQLKGLAVGTLLGIVRDIVAKAVPEPMERQVEDVIDGMTVKLA